MEINSLDALEHRADQEGCAMKEWIGTDWFVQTLAVLRDAPVFQNTATGRSSFYPDLCTGNTESNFEYLRISPKILP